MSWYALQVISGREEACQRALRQPGRKAYVPTQTFLRRVHRRDRRMVEVRRALMPGYVFLPAKSDLGAALDKPGVYDVLRLSDGYPAVIPRDQIKRLAKAAPAEPEYRGIKKGSYVEVMVGAFRGFKAEVLVIRKKHAEMSVSIFGKGTPLKLPLDALELVSERNMRLASRY